MTTYYTDNTPKDERENRTNPELVTLAEELFPFLPGDGWHWLPSYTDWHLTIVAPTGLQFRIEKELSWKPVGYPGARLWITQSAQRWEGFFPTGSSVWQPHTAKIGCSSTKGAEKIAKDDIIRRFLPDAEKTMVEESELIEKEIARRNNRDAIMDTFVALGGYKVHYDTTKVRGKNWEVQVSGHGVQVSTLWYSLTPEQAQQVVALLNTF